MTKTPESPPLSRPAAQPTLLLNRRDLIELMTPADYLAAVEHAFRASKAGRAAAPAPLHAPAVNGDFHAKAASLSGTRDYVALKFNGNFPGNPGRTGLPTIQGVILLCDAGNGAVLAIMDSIGITLGRTAAASALAARLLARTDASTLAICGCGEQGRAHALSLSQIFSLRRALVWDIDAAKASRFAAEMSDALGFAFAAAPSAGDAARFADVIVTCTTARSPILAEADVSPGAFIAAVGADNPAKSEIAPALMARAAVVVDALGQCLAMGDLRHAIEAGAMSARDVRGELADIVTGARPGRCAADEIVVFDSTGTAIADVASAALAYERACARGRGVRFALA